MHKLRSQLTANRVAGDNITANVVLITAATHAGSNGPLHYPADELRATVTQWANVPVTIGHPTYNGQGVSISLAHGWPVVGHLVAPAFDGNRLTATANLSRSALQRHAPELLRKLQRRERVEVSTGLFTDNQDGVAYNHRPDHLAILPGQRGACSNTDGCGLALNGAKKVKMFYDGFDPATLNQQPAHVEPPLLAPVMNFGDNGCGCGDGHADGGVVAAGHAPPPLPVQGAASTTRNATDGDSNNETPLLMPSTL